VELEQSMKLLQKELLKKEHLQTQMERLDLEKKSLKKKVMFFLLSIVDVYLKKIVFIEFQVELEQSKKLLQKESLKKENLQTQMKFFHSDYETLNKKVIFFFFV
jgi:hypothetical protein